MKQEKAEKEKANKKLLALEIVICLLSLAFLFAMIALGKILAEMEQEILFFWLLLGFGLAQFLACPEMRREILAEKSIGKRRRNTVGKGIAFAA